MKVPGPDGFPARFLQRNWDVLRDEVIAAMKDFFATGIMPSGVNETAIVLIPKVDEPENLSQFRSIDVSQININPMVAKPFWVHTKR